MPTTSALPRFRRTTNVRTIILVLSLCGLTVSLQQTSMVGALADLPDELGTTTENVSWIVTVTLLTSAVAMPIVSRLADMFGKRKMLLLCLGLVTVGSLIGAVGGSLAVILLGRALQGISFAIVPVGISVMRDLLPAHRIGAAVALMSATLGIGGAIGLPVGGLIYSTWGLSAVFLMSAAVGFILLVLVPLVVSESTIRSPGRVDYVGSILLSAALLALLLPISKGAVWGWGSGLTIGLFAASVVLIVIWIPYELHRTQPLVDLRTMARRPVMLTNVATVLIGFSMFGQLLGVTQLLTLPEGVGAGYGFSPLQAGLFLLPSGIVMVLLAPVSATISNRYGAKTTLLTGGCLVVLGYLVMIPWIGSLVALLVGSTVMGSGIALAYAAMPTLIMRSVPVTETASSNGLNALLRSIGTSSSSAVVALMLSSDVVHTGGSDVPTTHAFQMIFIVSAIGAAVGTAVATMLPPHRASLSNEEAFTSVRDPGAEYDPPSVVAERAEIEYEIAEGRSMHHHEREPAAKDRSSSREGG